MLGRSRDLSTNTFRNMVVHEGSISIHEELRHVSICHTVQCVMLSLDWELNSSETLEWKGQDPAGSF